MDLTEMNLAEKKRSIIVLLAIAALATGAHIVVSGLLHYLPHLQNLVATDLIFQLLLWLVMAAAIPVCISAIRGKKLCFLQEFAALYAFYNLLLMLENLLAIGSHIHLLYQLGYGVPDMLYTVVNLLPVLTYVGLSAVSGILLYRGVQQKERAFFIVSVCLAAAAYAAYLIKWWELLHFHLFYLLMTVMVLLHEKKRN